MKFTTKNCSPSTQHARYIRYIATSWPNEIEQTEFDFQLTDRSIKGKHVRNEYNLHVTLCFTLLNGQFYYFP